MLLTGKFSRSLDDKLRLAIPKRLRDALEDPQIKYLYVVPGTDGSLGIYTQATLQSIGERLASNSPAQQDVRAFNRLFYAQAECAELDAQGRIRIPAELAESAGLNKEAILLGVNDHMELWNPSRWQAYFAEKGPHYDEIAEAAFRPPSGP